MELILEDGTVYSGRQFGYKGSVAGEVIFNTGMVGYPEVMTDPSYKGQILVFTFPLIGNYGIPVSKIINKLEQHFESDKIHLSGIVVTNLTEEYSHWNAVRSLSDWMTEHQIPGIEGVDTRAITKRLRAKGTQLGKLLFEGHDLPFYDPSMENLVAQVSCSQPILYNEGAKKRVVLVDNGCKNNIIRSLISRDVEVLRVPWNYDYTSEQYDGVFLSNGPGDPVRVDQGIQILKKQLQKNHPVFGICMGHQLLALACGGQTYKLKFGHHSQNQPCVLVGSKRCYITSQNHNYAVDDQILPEGFSPWFFNANDGSNEGMIHQTRPLRSVQFHPEAWPGPVDTQFLFDQFVSLL